MPDSDKTPGQDMLAKSWDERLMRKRHFQPLSTFAIIFVLEGNLPIVNTFDAMVTDRYLMGVASQIFYYRIRVLEGTFGIDYPWSVE